MDGLANMISDAIYPQVNPRITFETIDDKTIVIADILPGQNQPYCLKAEGSLDGVYIRVAATTRKAEREKIRELVLLGEGKSYDKLFERHAPASEQAIKNLCKVIEQYSHKRSVRLENMLGWGLLKEDNGKLSPSIAFSLLAENDLHFARIQCGLFKGTDKVYFLDRKEFDGPLNEQIDNAYNFILQHINIGAEIKGLYRKDVPEIPTEVIRELIVNAVMHRNYLAHSNIQVCIFDDRIEITNPGGLYGGLTLEKMLSGISSIRNELIADIFLKMGIVEKWGTGLLRIADICRETGSNPVQYQTGSGFLMATLLRKGVVDDTIKVPVTESCVPVNVPEQENGVPVNVPVTNLSDRERQVLKFIIEKNCITAKEIAEKIGASEKTVKRAIRTLKANGCIIRVGSDKKGFWSIKE